METNSCQWVDFKNLIKNVDVLFIVINPLEVRCLESSQPSFIEKHPTQECEISPYEIWLFVYKLWICKLFYGHGLPPEKNYHPSKTTIQGEG